MNIELKKEKKSKREMKITISTDEMEEYLSQAADDISKNMTIKGFRSGKAPIDVIENTVGKEELWKEAAKVAVENTYEKALNEKKLFPLSQPEVEFVKLSPGNEFIYKAVFYVMPEVDLPDYKKIAKAVKKEEKSDSVSVSKKEVDETLEKIRNSRATRKKIDRKAKEEDEVSISFTGKMDDKKIMEEDQFNFKLGAGHFAGLKGFEDHIIGMESGEETEFEVKIPDDNPNKELAGEKVTFELKLDSVFKRELPELTDEFADSLHGEVSTVKELKEKIEEGIKEEKEMKKDESLKMKIIDKIIEETEMEIPEVLVERELDNMEEQMERKLQQSGLTFEDYLKQIDKEKEDLREDWRERAEKNVSAAIVLHKIGEKEEVEVKKEEVEKEVDKHFKMSGQSKDDETEEGLNRLRRYVADIKKNQKIFDILTK